MPLWTLAGREDENVIIKTRNVGYDLQKKKKITKVRSLIKQSMKYPGAQEEMFTKDRLGPAVTQVKNKIHELLAHFFKDVSSRNWRAEASRGWCPHYTSTYS